MLHKAEEPRSKSSRKRARQSLVFSGTIVNNSLSSSAPSEKSKAWVPSLFQGKRERKAPIKAKRRLLAGERGERGRGARYGKKRKGDLNCAACCVVGVYGCLACCVASLEKATVRGPKGEGLKRERKTCCSHFLPPFSPLLVVGWPCLFSCCRSAFWVALMINKREKGGRRKEEPFGE